MLVGINALDIFLVPYVLGMTVPAISPCIGRGHNLILFNFQEIHRGVGFRVNIVALEHHFLKLFTDLYRKVCAIRDVIRHKAKNGVLVTLRINGVTLTLNAAEMIFDKLIVDHLGQSMVIIFHLDRPLTILNRCVTKGKGTGLIVAVVVEKVLVQTDHLQQMTAIHNIFLNIGVDPTVPVILGIVDHALLTALASSSIS